MNISIISASRSSVNNPPPCFSNPIDNFDPRTDSCRACDYADNCSKRHDEAFDKLAGSTNKTKFDGANKTKTRKPFDANKTKANKSLHANKTKADSANKTRMNKPQDAKKTKSGGANKPKWLLDPKAYLTPELFKFIRDLDRLKAIVRKGDALVLKNLIPETKLKRLIQRLGREKQWLPFWDKTNDIHKIVALVRELEQHEKTSNDKLFCISPRLSPKEQERILTREGRNDLLQRLRVKLRAVIPDPRYFITIEFDANLQPHLHGIIAIPPDTKKAVRGAVKAACGEWDAPTGKQFQLRGEEPTNIDGWGYYCIQDRPRTMKCFKKLTPAKERPKSVIMAPNSLRKSAGISWNSLKASQLPADGDPDCKPPHTPKPAKPHSAGNTDSATTTSASKTPATAKEHDPKTTGDASNEANPDQLRDILPDVGSDTAGSARVRIERSVSDSERPAFDAEVDQPVARLDKRRLLPVDDKKGKADATGHDEIVAPTSFDIADVIDEIEALEIDDDDILEGLDDTAEFEDDELGNCLPELLTENNNESARNNEGR